MSLEERFGKSSMELMPVLTIFSSGKWQQEDGGAWRLETLETNWSLVYCLQSLHRNFVELQCLQRNIWQIFYMNSSVYGEVRSRESTRLIWTGTVLK